MDPSRSDMKICRQAYLFTLGLLCVSLCLHSEMAGSWVHFNENEDKQITNYMRVNAQLSTHMLSLGVCLIEFHQKAVLTQNFVVS